GAIIAHGHETVSEQMSVSILDSFHIDEHLKEQVIFIIRYHMMAHNKETTARSLRRLVRKGGKELVDQLLQHGVADVAGGCRDFTDCDRLRRLFNHIDEVPKKVCAILTGEEIMEITKLKQGPEIGRIMRYLSSLGNIDKEQAMKILKNAD